MNTTSHHQAKAWHFEDPTPEQIEAVAKLNDDMRRNPRGKGKKLMLTPGVQDLGMIDVVLALRRIAAFTDFNDGNNPHGERDFGKVTVGGRAIWFKIDCYDPDMLHGSEDAADPAKTVRVMTLMLPEEY